MSLIIVWNILSRGYCPETHSIIWQPTFPHVIHISFHIDLDLDFYQWPTFLYVESLETSGQLVSVGDATNATATAAAAQPSIRCHQVGTSAVTRKRVWRNIFCTQQTHTCKINTNDFKSSCKQEFSSLQEFTCKEEFFCKQEVSCKHEFSCKQEFSRKQLILI